MKGFLFGLIFLGILGIGGYLAVQVLKNQPNQKTEFKTEAVTKVGILQSAKGDDYSHLLLTEGKSIGVSSYTVNLNQYTGKKVEVRGQFSGTTLYADTVNIVK